jgi:hypothetical protein
MHEALDLKKHSGQGLFSVLFNIIQFLHFQEKKVHINNADLSYNIHIIIQLSSICTLLKYYIEIGDINMKKTWRRFFCLTLAAVLCFSIFPESFFTLIHASSSELQTGKTLVAKVQMDGASATYYYEEDTKGHNDNASFIITEAWSDASKLSSDNHKNVTFTLYHDWIRDPDTFEMRYETSSVSCERAFESSNSYYRGTINVFSEMTLDLNGYVINRGYFDKGGSVISVESGGSLTIEDSNAGAVHWGYLDGSRKWIRHEDDKQVMIKGGIICGGYNKKGAGGIGVFGNGKLTINGGNITGNTSEYGGAGLCVDSDEATVIMNGGSISYNCAYEANGGGVAMYNFSYQEKERDKNGDVIIHQNKDGGMIMTGGEIVHNYSIESYMGNGGNGAGVYICSDGMNYNLYEGTGGAFFLTGGLIGFCDAEDNGGGLYQESGGVYLYGGFVTSNFSQGNGGGLYANGTDDSNQLKLKGVSVLNNTCLKNGGGLYINTKKVDVYSATIINNKAGYDTSKSSDAGSGIYIATADYIIFSGGIVYCQNNGYHNLFLRTDSDIYNDSSLASQSIVYVSSKAGNDGGDYIRFTSDGDCARISKNCFRSDYDGYYIDKNVNNNNFYFEKGKDPDTGSSVGADTYTVSGTSYTNATAKKYDFNYTSVTDMADTASSIYYTDAFFNNNATVYDQHLATASLGVAMAAFKRPYDAEDEQAKNIIDLYKSLGFSNFTTHYPLPAETDDGYTIGYEIGTKKLAGGTNLIAIAVRGANYTTEWASNALINDSAADTGEAKGFSNAADQVMEGIQDYIAENNLASSNTKFWITGYSRGGAVANLTARRVIDGLDYASNDNVYAYTFEAPQGAVSTVLKGNADHTTWDSSFPKSDPASYTSIHNLINKEDLVPTVAPGIMGFTRYGIDHYIPGDTSSSDNSTNYLKSGTAEYNNLRTKMMKQLNKINSNSKQSCG